MQGVTHTRWGNSMLKKLMTAFIILAYSSAYGNAPVPGAYKKSLGNAFNELEYSLTVEWDQNDQAFANKKLAQFEADVKKLQEEGMTRGNFLFPDCAAAEKKN